MASRLWSCETLVAGMPLLAEMDNTNAPPATDLKAKIEVTCLIRPKQSNYYTAQDPVNQPSTPSYRSIC